MRKLHAWIAVLLIVMVFAQVAEATETGTVSALSFPKTEYKMKPRENLALAALLIIRPTGAVSPIVWISSKPDVATVDELGNVTAVMDGSAKISASLASDPSIYATTTIKITAVRVRTLTINPKTAILDVGGTLQLATKATPANPSFPEVTWTSGADAVATVDQAGLVTAVAPGKAKITAATDRGRVTQTMVVRVRGGTMRTLKISAIGDVVLGGDKTRVPKADDYIRDNMTSFGRFKALYDKYGQDYFFEKVQSVFASDDLTIANLECQITDSTNAYPKSVNLSGPSKYRTIASRAGIDVVCMANNHLNDFYANGYRDTIRNMNSVGIQTYGVGGSSCMVKNVAGVRVGIAGFVIPANRAAVANTLRGLKRSRKCDVVMVSFHWTQSPEWTSAVYAGERAMARFAVNSGADLVLGHHKHFISGVEQYKSKMIVYDLGNFVSLIRHVTQTGSYVSKDSMIYQQKFNVFDDGYLECVAPSIIPCLNSKSQETFTGQPHILSGSEADRVLSKIRAKSPSSSQSLVCYQPEY